MNRFFPHRQAKAPAARTEHTPPEAVPEVQFWQKGDATFYDQPSDVSSVRAPQRFSSPAAKRTNQWARHFFIGGSVIASAALIFSCFAFWLPAMLGRPVIQKPAPPAATLPVDPVPDEIPAATAMVATRESVEPRVASESSTQEPTRASVYVQGHWVNRYTRQLPAGEHPSSSTPEPGDDLVTRSGRTYRNARFSRMESGWVMIICASGEVRITVDDLPDDWRTRYAALIAAEPVITPTPSYTPIVQAPVSSGYAASGGSSSSTYVNGYTRKDGTYVHGYTRHGRK